MKALIIGAARSGTAITKLLLKQGYQCTLIDTKNVGDKQLWKQLGVVIHEGEHPTVLWHEDFDLIVKNPGISHHDPFIVGFVQRGHVILTEIEVAARFAPNYRYAAITGTNGKTTTTSILAAMLKAQDPRSEGCGNIGLPLSQVVDALPYEKMNIALEIAAFQLLGCFNLKPVVSVILNLTPDHLDVFENIDEYYKAKCRVYQTQDKQDWFLKNLDDANIDAYCRHISATVVTYSMEKPADLWLKDDSVLLFNEVLFDPTTFKLKGKHNLQNAMVAAAMAFKMGVKIQTIQEVIASFKGVEHRLEYVSTIDGVEYYNDSKGTTAESTVVALQSFKQAVILLAGGYDKKTGFEVLRPVLGQIRTLIAYGATKNQFKELYPDAYLVDTLQDAIHLAHHLATQGDIVLFSPACASYDQFNNYEERGRLFKEWVLKLKN